MITAVAGIPGSGKTHWIREQIAKTKVSVTYFSPQTESFAIDAICFKSEFPQLNILSAAQQNQLLNSSIESTTYIELPWYLDLASIEAFLDQLNCHRVALMSSPSQDDSLLPWADEIILGNSLDEGIKIDKNKPFQIYRATLTGEILDFASLETFWAELTQGAYGYINRIKGIFDILDGRLIYGEFIKGRSPIDFQPLNFPLCLEGRPKRFSGIEIVGHKLDKDAIADTLGDCCLSDEAIAYYQQQIKESLASEIGEVQV